MRAAPIFVSILFPVVSSAFGHPLSLAISQCSMHTPASARLESCSAVISQTKDRVLLERAFNRRGHANVELGQYDAAVKDFSNVIRLNPRIAGYYDNRRNAYRLLGRLGTLWRTPILRSVLHRPARLCSEAVETCLQKWGAMISPNSITPMQSRWSHWMQVFM